MNKEKVEFYQIKGYIGLGGNIYVIMAEDSYMGTIYIDVACLINDSNGTLIMNRIKGYEIKEEYGLDQIENLAKEHIENYLNTVSVERNIECQQIIWDKVNKYDLISLRNKKKLVENLKYINQKTENVTLKKEVNNLLRVNREVELIIEDL